MNLKKLLKPCIAGAISGVVSWKIEKMIKEHRNENKCGYDMNFSQLFAMQKSLVVNHDAFVMMNPEYLGFLTIPDTEIALPVVMGDDNAYYQGHGFTKRKSPYGCPYVDANFLVTDTIMEIHGQNMGKGSDKVFSTLDKFKSPEYAQNHRFIYFSSCYTGEFVYEIFAVKSYPEEVLPQDHFLFFSGTDEEYLAMVTALQKNAFYKNTDHVGKPQSQIMILSTPDLDSADKARLLVCAERLTDEARVHSKELLI